MNFHSGWFGPRSGENLFVVTRRFIFDCSLSVEAYKKLCYAVCGFLFIFLVNRWLVVIAACLGIYFAPLSGLAPEHRHLLAFFTATILALALRPAPLGVIMFLSITLIAGTKTLSLETTLSGFGNPTAWLIFLALLLAQALAQTRLGLRIAYLFISRIGDRSLTLGYAVAASNFVLAPFAPSDTARAGIMAPVVKSVAQILGSEPDRANSRTGSYLVLVAFHTNYVASAMFLTSMVGNPLIAKLTKDITGVDLTWADWAAASSVPAILTFLIVPWLIHHLQPPRVRDTTHALDFARGKLSEMGPISFTEKQLLVVMAGIIIGWATSPWHHLGNTEIAFAGVCALLLGGLMEWESILGNKQAWEVLVWFAPILMMSDQLSKQGVMQVIFAPVFNSTHEWPWAVAFAALAMCYFYAHYGFASLTAQISALFPAFLLASVGAGAPAALAAWSLAFYSNLNAGLTHYGTGSAPIYFGEGYVSQSKWWTIGLIISLVNVSLWIGVGPVWWHLIGLW